ncbi:hypothetical protein HYX58_05840 [Candidatus Dependentiae bacterium]|nr:hypothetical protein [Candidatus Dependentiae bacterium]
MSSLLKSFLIVSICVAPATSHGKSQDSADTFIQKLFGDKRTGVFFDVGATDGITNNRTYYLEKELGWVGACIESTPSSYEKLRTCRLAVCINAAIAPQSGSLPFLRITAGHNEQNIAALSGPLASFEPVELKIALERAYNLKGKIDFTDMPCFTFAQVMEALELNHLDLLCIAKSEQMAEVLKTIDFNMFDVDVIVVENAGSNHEIQKTLITNGFVLIRKFESEEIYRNTKYYSSKSNYI